ncbi:hypothetical protein NMG60_11007394 [Bertholletia excelsa]
MKIAGASSPEAEDGATASSSPSRRQSVEIIAGNDDVLMEILLRCPVKSLVRFKCVSSHWHSLISGSQFSLLHTLCNLNCNFSGLLLRKRPYFHPTSDGSDFEFVALDGGLSGVPPLRSLDFVHPSRSSGSGIKILQSCNGLLLCCSYPYTIGTIRNYYVVNPTTKQYVVVDPPQSGSSTTTFGISLAFDPSKSPRYKMVLVRSTPQSIYSYQIEIYTAESHSWRICSDCFTKPFDMLFTDGVFWNGAIHWISPSGASSRFDVDSECVKPMPAAPVVRRDWRPRRYRYFGESNDHLHLIEVYGSQTREFQVFELKRDYSEWLVKYSVNLDGCVAAFPEMVRNCPDSCDEISYAFSILGVLRGSNEDDSFLVLNVPGMLVSYKFKDGSLKKLLNFGPGKINKSHVLQFGCYDSYQFFVTLAPV